MSFQNERIVPFVRPGVEIGRMFKEDYSTVSQGRQRLRAKMGNDPKISAIVKRIGQRLSI